MKWPKKILDALESVTEQELRYCAPTLDTQTEEQFVGGSRENSVVDEEIRRCHCLCVRYHKRTNAAMEALSQASVSTSSDMYHQKEHEAMDAYRYFTLYFLFMAISLREKFSSIPPRPNVEIGLRMGWVAVWREVPQVVVIAGRRSDSDGDSLLPSHTMENSPKKTIH